MTRRLLIGLIAVAASLACGGGSGTGSTGGSPPSSTATTAAPGPSGSTVSFKETEYSIAPQTMTLKPGAYTFTVQNVGQFPHDLHIATADGSEVGATTVMKANDSASVNVTLKAGTYSMWCAVNAHKSLGMVGTLTVQ